MKLYLYEHCPFCVRAQMIVGLRNVDYQPQVLLNDDEATPINMIGKKSVPILQRRDGRFMAESLDIVSHIDNLLGMPILSGPTNPLIAQWLNEASDTLFKLAIPRWAQAPLPEFATASARAYFIQNKTRMFGAFSDLLEQTPALISQAERDLRSLAELIVPGRGCNGMLSDDDILLFPYLRALSIVANVSYPVQVNNYRLGMALRANVQLHDTIAL
jgi:glutaredoxin 2